MDDIDRRLIGLLRRDARASVADLARALGVARGTVVNRMRRLESEGVILGYTLRLGGEAAGEGVRAWMMIGVEGAITRKVVDALVAEPGVEALYDTNGRWDLLAELRVATMAELSQTLDRVRRVKGVRATETNIHLATLR